VPVARNTSQLLIDINNAGGDIYTSVPSAVVDTGGVYGDIPQSLYPGPTGSYLPPGTTIEVAAPGPNGGAPVVLYTEVVGTQPNAMQITAGDFNTGNYAFTKLPIYFSYSPDGTGTTFFDTESS
jgi:hypothetical protein